MNLNPKQELSETEIQHGLTLVIGDGLATEAMTVLAGGTFLVALAVLMGASNLQIGFLAALPTFTNIFQLISIWLVRRYNNRRAITVICSLLARFPLVIVGSMLLLVPAAMSIGVLIVFLSFFYFLGSIAGPSWNSWMKDLVPGKAMGAYFARRGRLTQMLNIVLSIGLALILDYVKDHYPDNQLPVYAVMIGAGGIIGIIGALVLGQVPEPRGELLREPILKLIRRPLQDQNFRRLLVFNSAWVFAINIATPFFTVFLLKKMNMPLSYIVALGIIGQIGSILTIRLWGAFSDRYSNKTVIALCAPLYIACFVAWSFVGLYRHMYMSFALLILIYLFTGISTAGINLSLTNIGLKLAPRIESIVYLSTKNIITAFFSSISPLAGGYLADYFMRRYLSVRVEWGGPNSNRIFRLIELHEWNFLFLLAALLALLAMELLMRIKEEGEVEKEAVRRILRKSVKGNLKEYFLIGHLMSWQEQLWAVIKKRRASK